MTDLSTLSDNDLLRATRDWDKEVFTCSHACAECGAWFESSNPRAKFCSKTCRNSYNDRERRTVYYMRGRFVGG